MLLGASWLCASKAAAAAAQSEGDDDKPGERWRRREAVTAAAAGEDMDESSLLDLLECSVCLERLDTTAKVLPCQHTFCRRCLESIVCSRHELRCPECRILVGCGVDELPANILLVRLLDGIRQRPRVGASPGGSPPARPVPGSGAASELAGGGGSVVSSAAGSVPCSPGFPLAAGSATASLRELATSRSAPLSKGFRCCHHRGGDSDRRVQILTDNPSQLPYGKALYSYEGKEPGDLKFNKGDVIILRRRVDEHWFHGELHGAHGFLPASYVQCLRPLPPAPPQGKALYDFEMKDQDQDKDCLTFTKDEILTVIRRVDDNWAEGMLGDKIGIFPLLYVEDSSSSAGSIPAAEQQGTAPKVQLPLNVYLALYAYKPQKNDELELRKGEMYRVLEKCQDGWFKGTSLRTGLSGVFPGNYVTPASRAPWNNMVGGSPLAKGMATTIHPGGGSLSSPSTATRPALPLNSPQAQAASPLMGSCLRHSAKPVASQARSTVPTAAHSAQAQDRPTATVSPLRSQSSPSRLPTASLRPHSMVSPQHIHQSPMQTVIGVPCPRSVIPLMSAASAITPPNVNAANLNGEAGGGAISGLSTSSPTNTGCKPDEKKNEKKEKKTGLLKLLAGASTKKKSRSPPSISPTHDPPVAVDTSLQGAVGPEVSSLSIHGRAGSCPIESEMQGAMGMEPLHRKAGSLDLNFSSSPSKQAPPSMAAFRPEPKPLPRERYRVVVSYPPQSEAEIELKEGDIVFVHKKREDGWYKGTLQRNGRTGLFPGSFVENF
ncbi:SH3 domain-containing RING finger protein 3 isoform X4 [Pteropus alecto]|uniref:SH3 domain-containing RING finger protein 3 isoform X4 n=1 Tax=Pteropus alecto TaxID=9402 RepID=UPI00076852BA|nr:SH3 domain-containing RING finger protein 3 isoform X4 [Pteropus alecto]